GAARLRSRAVWRAGCRAARRGLLTVPTRRRQLTTEQRQVERFRERPLRPSQPDLKPKGELLVIGGHEDKHDERLILRYLARHVEIFAGGGMIAGTSAGASVMSETMLIGGGSNGSHRIGPDLQLAPGLGLAHDMVIDQHFAERGRIGRLLAVVAQNPRILGVG